MLVRNTDARGFLHCRFDCAGHHGRLIETWRFSRESSDSTSVEEIIELNEKIFKSRIISQEGPGKPESQVLPSEIFTVTRVTTKK